MKNLITSSIIATITSLIGFAQESGKNFIDQNFIEVSGYAEKEITPNRIYLNIVINEKNTKGQSLPEVEKLMMDKLREIGIDVTSDLTIKDFISNFQYYAIFKSDIIFIKEYEVVLYEAEKVGKVFIELEKLGISNISIDRLDHNEIEKYKQEIKIEAIKAAKEKATALTFAINQEIGRALYISEDLNSFNVSNNLQGQASGLYRVSF